MRRYTRSLILIGIVVLLAGLVLGFQHIKIGGFERGGDTPLGLTLGLDLQGGSHLVYQASARDPNTGEPVPPTKEQMDALQRNIERRVNTSGLGEPNIQVLGSDRLLVQLPGVRDLERAKAIVGQTARLEFKHRMVNVPRPLPDVNSQIVSVTLEALPELTPTATPTPSATTTPGATPEATGTPTPEATATPTPSPTATPTATPTSTPTPEATGTSAEQAGAGTPTPGASPTPGPSPTPVPPPVVMLELTDQGAQRMAAVLQEINESFRPVPGTGVIYADRVEVALEGKGSRKFESIFVQRVEGTNKFYIVLPTSVASTVEEARNVLGDQVKVTLTHIKGKVDEDIGLTGDDLARAYPGQHATTGRPIVNIEFTPRGARIFGEITGQIAGKPDQIAIFLDEQELIAPVARQAITGGTAYIEGGADFTVERVRDIALLLEAGRLPIPITLVQERDVDATLGADSLAKSVVAGLVGLGIVFLFMTLYYRVPGLVAAVALVIYAAVNLAIFKILPVTLTLAGAAGVILSIGMAVDGNILIFERMKEELRLGRTLLSAINIGFDRAWPAIRDGNVTALISAGILFWFADQLGTTIVQGFAATLAIGVMLSMFSAITVSRPFLQILATSRLGKRLGLFIPVGAAQLPQRQQPAAPVTAPRS